MASSLLDRALVALASRGLTRLRPCSTPLVIPGTGIHFGFDGRMLGNVALDGVFGESVWAFRKIAVLGS
jgi:hypothetical protein